MDEWKHPIALELRHEEKIIGGKLSKRQIIWLAPALILIWLLSNFPFWLLFRVVMPKGAAVIAGYIVYGVIALMILGFAAIMAFVPARMVWFFDNPKPKANIDPYDVDEPIDTYLRKKRRNKGKAKLLPYRVVKN